MQLRICQPPALPGVLRVGTLVRKFEPSAEPGTDNQMRLPWLEWLQKMIRNREVGVLAVDQQSRLSHGYRSSLCISSEGSAFYSQAYQRNCE